jgi:hypothetical protein
MSKNGRPEILDESKRNIILAILSVGCSRATAAAYVHCAPRTIYNTARRDPAFARRMIKAEMTVMLQTLFNLRMARRYF